MHTIEDQEPDKLYAKLIFSCTKCKQDFETRAEVEAHVEKCQAKEANNTGGEA